MRYGMTSGIWRCTACGVRIAGATGASPAWRWSGESYQHACEGGLPQSGASPCEREETAGERAALLGCVESMARWADEEGGLPGFAWDAFVRAHDALGVEAPASWRRWGDL